MDKRNIIGKQVKNIRKNKKITQEQLTARLHVLGIEIDRTMISKIENQTRHILDYELKAIAEALSIDINKLFE
ncbi:helix-turn-helix transcriptional regulator [Inediibacterium massiliense]|uniref:helix-turn-helix domain-containing protein n=1 Tax=Inediibacterium massiliense TaxID=1658111 RepID=UPI002E8E35B6|nr:helix-turn-helix transcriptional regulator [Inediibacterium massiliense]